MMELNIKLEAGLKI